MFQGCFKNKVASPKVCTHLRHTHLVRERRDYCAHGDEDDPDGRRDHCEGVHVQVVVDGVDDARDQEAERVPRSALGHLGEGPCGGWMRVFQRRLPYTASIGSVRFGSVVQSVTFPTSVN